MDGNQEIFLAHLIRKGEIDAYTSKNFQALNLEEVKPVAIRWAENWFADNGGVHHPTSLYLKHIAQNYLIKEWGSFDSPRT